WASLVHVVRNAVDHGIETKDERLGQGKSPEGHLVLRALHTSRELRVEIEDDGRGIDWVKVAELASRRGLLHETRADLIGAILADGFSTKSEVTATSGRGVGMSAIHQQVMDLGGTLSVRSEPEHGTCWLFQLPLSSVRTVHGLSSAG